MSGENIASVEDAGGDEADGRQRSSIGFPYNHIADAIEVANAIHGHVGTGECDDAQLSAWMGVSSKSSGFRIQLSAARMFGFIETTNGSHKLTPLGRSVVDPQQEREARARAFLNVPLYKAVFEKYKGGVLPPPAAFERDIVGMGVAEKQKNKARQVFERSAEQSGFFEHGKNRLVMPAIAVREQPLEVQDEDPNKKKGGDDDGGGLDLDPLLIALLKKIPPSESDWPAAQRVRWFRTFAMNVSQIYDEDSEPVEMKIELEKEAAN